MTSGPDGRSSREESRPLRVVLTELSYHPDFPSGPARLCYEEAKYLLDRGHEVWLLAAGLPPGVSEHAIVDGLHLLRYRRPRWAALDPRTPGVHQRRARRVLQRYVPSSVDIVHCHTLLPGAAALDHFSGRARVCYSLHSPVKNEFRATARGASMVERLRLRLAGAAHHRLERRCLECADVVTVDSRFARELVERVHGASLAARVCVERPWIDPSHFAMEGDRHEARAALGWPSDVPVLFCLRRLVPRMGLDRLLDAAALMAGRPFKLVIAGSGPLEAHLKDAARARGLHATVAFAGGVSDAILPRMYRAADAFVLPTAELECFGLVAVEAMAAGRPVLATPTGAIREVVGAVEPRWLAADESAHAIAALVGDFLDGRLPAHPTARLREAMQAQFSTDQRIPKMIRRILEPGVASGAAVSASCRDA